MSSRYGRYVAALRRLILTALALGIVLAALAVWRTGAAMTDLRERAHPIPTTECEEGKTCERKSLQIEAREAVTADGAFDVALGQLALSILGFGGLGFTVYYAHRAFVEAQRSANAAQASADSFMAAERAYVFFLDTEPGPSVHKATSYRVIWRNFGKTPALVTGVRLGVSMDDEGADPATMPRYEMPFGAVIAAGDPWPRGQRAITDDMMREHNEQARPIWLCGEITYRDIHGKDHRSWFCRLYTGKQFILDDSCGAAFNGYD